MDDPISDLAAVTAVAVLLRAAGVKIISVSINDLVADIQIIFEHWPQVRECLSDLNGVVTVSTRHDKDDIEHLHHRLSFENRVAVVSIKRRSTNAA